MNEFLSELLMTVITAAVPVLSAYAITLIRKALRPRRPLLRQVRQPLPLLLLHRQRFSRLPLSRLLLKRSTDDTVRAPYRAYSLYYSEHLF